MTLTGFHQLIAHIIQSFFVNLKENVSFILSPTSDKEIQLVGNLNSSEIIKRTRTLMHNQYEWLFVNMTVDSKNINVFDFHQSVIIYTVSISWHRHTQAESKHFPFNFLPQVITSINNQKYYFVSLYLVYPVNTFQREALIHLLFPLDFIDWLEVQMQN